MSVSNLVAAVKAKIAHEPVIVWGLLVACLAGVLLSLGVDAAWVAAFTGAAQLLGIPVVRGQVTPLDVLKAAAPTLLTPIAAPVVTLPAPPVDVTPPNLVPVDPAAPSA